MIETSETKKVLMSLVFQTLPPPSRKSEMMASLDCIIQMAMVILSRPHLILTANQGISVNKVNKATEIREACSEQCILGISLSLHELRGGSQLCTNHPPGLQGGMWTGASMDLPNHGAGLLATPKFLLLCSALMIGLMSFQAVWSPYNLSMLCLARLWH